MEKALRDSEEKHRRFFSEARDAIVVIDGETEQILEANRAALALYGYSGQDICRLKVADLSAEPEKSQAAISSLLKNKSDPFIAWRQHRKQNGSLFPVEISASSIVLNDRVMVMATIRDITQSHEAEQTGYHRVSRASAGFEGIPGARDRSRRRK